jgi:hypothetical protein
MSEVYSASLLVSTLQHAAAAAAAAGFRKKICGTNAPLLPALRNAHNKQDDEARKDVFWYGTYGTQYVRFLCSGFQLAGGQTRGDM